ncbi:hypothetical protein HanHA300_Chr03g0114881 [Helianthus annuus]|nr:hypothetical protein HanHA300_Chr03g0114881 [Helianthus annuus]KAJ0775869.1 hypothetical protein HanOQP8_Chr03g0127491 [Helianthus annuus]KAJ0946068.1 hypothetical protein HanPSC8_Chr03g0135111 [Helianthus annuus]
MGWIKASDLPSKIPNSPPAARASCGFNNVTADAAARGRERLLVVEMNSCECDDDDDLELGMNS